jgi:hypothetical protein
MPQSVCPTLTTHIVVHNKWSTKSGPQKVVHKKWSTLDRRTNKCFQMWGWRRSGGSCAERWVGEALGVSKIKRKGIAFLVNWPRDNRSPVEPRKPRTRTKGGATSSPPPVTTIKTESKPQTLMKSIKIDVDPAFIKPETHQARQDRVESRVEPVVNRRDRQDILQVRRHP